MSNDIRILTLSDVPAYQSLVAATAADLQASGNPEFLYFHTPEVRDRALAEGRIVGHFVDNLLIGAVTFEEGDISDILQQRFPDVADVPQGLGDGIYTSNGMVIPKTRCKGVLTGIMQHIVDMHPTQQVTGTMHYENVVPQRVHAAIGSFPVAILHSATRPTMVLCARPAYAERKSALA